MKKSVCYLKLWGFTLAIIAACCLSGCQDDFDDSEIRRQMEDLANRVGSLETLCNQMNTNISSIQTIVNALQQQDYITGVNPVTEGSVVIGYTITFAKNKAITVYHGEDGKDGADGNDGKDGKDGVSPLMGVEKDADGLFYWKLNGEWLKDKEGQKIKASGNDGKDGITPRLKIEDGYWWMSVDNGQTWNKAGQATGDAFFKEIDNSAEDYVRFIFMDGTEIRVPKNSSFAISFGEEMPLKIKAGETIEVAYTLSQGDDKTQVKTLVQNGWKAVVNKKDNLSGSITITAPAPITDDEILVFISDGKEKTVMSAISFCIVIVEGIQENTVKVAGGGGDLYFDVKSNMAVEAEPVEEWIRLDTRPETKALTTYNYHFTVAANENEESRTGTIEIKAPGGKVMQTISVVQGNALDEKLAKEREILTKFYYATNGDGWENNTNWCSGKPVGEWYGVETDGKGLVSRIRFVGNFNGNNLSGQLIPELGELSQLVLLEIQFSKISGTIPVELCQLPYLYHLNLSYNQLSGEIPAEISQLNNLSTLYLHNNQFTGEIPASIWQMPRLSYIELNHNQLSGELPENISDLKQLAYLDLGYNQFSGTIPASICRLVDLGVLYLNNNQFSGEIPREIGNLKKLRWLNLGHKKELYSSELRTNQLTGTIPESIRQCESLESIDFSHNQLSGDMMLDFFIGQTSSLYLDHNNLTGTIPVELADWMNQSSHSFNISYNCLSGTIPLEVVTDPEWAPSKEYIMPQNDGYHLDMPDIYESKDYSEDGKVVTLQQATEGNGVNIVISGDGFADVDFANGHFDAVMNKTMEALFSLEPMKSFRHLFNIYVVKAVSKHNIFFEGSETAYNCSFRNGSSYVTHDGIIINEKYGPKVENFKAERDVFILIVNAYSPLGTTTMALPEGSSHMVCGLYWKSYPEKFRNTVCHEFGHAFGKLADEYWEYDALPVDEVKKELILQAHSWDCYVNVDITDDPTQVIWSKFITDERYANEGIGVFEGGKLCNKGVWRPTDNSMMRNSFGDVTFNAPSREAIYKRIMKLAYGDSWQYDYEKFVEYDAINRSTVPRLLRRTTVVPKDFKPLAPPVIIWK